MSDVKEKKVSVYTVLNRWLFDGSKETKIPDDVEKDKSISQMYLLYYFRPSPYGLVISKLLNNWSIFQLDRIELLYFLKECISLSGYKPPFIPKLSAKKNKLTDLLKEKYPFLKMEEVQMLVEKIDVSEEKDRYYETFGLYTPKNKKLTKAQREQFEKNKPKVQEEVSLDNLMENFQ